MKLAFVVATRDRPEELRRMLRNVADQSCQPAQVVIVDAGDPPVERVTAEFASLNTKYIRHAPPSAARQRNAGIEAIDAGIDLVAFLDDDAVLEPGALQAMLSFWEGAPSDMGGAAFNWVNCPQRSASWLKSLRITSWLGLYSGKGGVVMPSGWQTIPGEVPETTFAEWLPSGASVWRRQVLDEFRFDEWFDGYSYLEDLDFSYAVGKRYRLAIVADAGFRHYPSPSGRVSSYQFGKTEVRNRLYVVRKHNLSVPRCCLGLSVRLLMTLASALRGRRLASNLRRACGNCVALCAAMLGRPART